uniref:Zinc finger and BTB domain containing 25 n=1 Tax=Myripristis murdjan TaxID=586833 RepID=A0A668A420_9TELE
MDVSAHSLFLLQQLNVQREFGFLCDCTVAIGNVYFKAHRAVLAAFSNYFKMIFIHQSRSASIACAVCSLRFSHKSQLQEHMYTHTGKPSRYHRYNRLCSQLLHCCCSHLPLFLPSLLSLLVADILCCCTTV